MSPEGISCFRLTLFDAKFIGMVLYNEIHSSIVKISQSEGKVINYWFSQLLFSLTVIEHCIFCVIIHTWPGCQNGNIPPSHFFDPLFLSIPHQVLSVDCFHNNYVKCKQCGETRQCLACQSLKLVWYVTFEKGLSRRLLIWRLWVRIPFCYPSPKRQV